MLEDARGRYGRGGSRLYARRCDAEEGARRICLRRALAELRAERGITQGQLAKMIGSSQRAISHYETVAEFPPTSVVIQVAEALKVTTDEVLGVKPIRAARAAEDPEARRL